MLVAEICRYPVKGLQPETMERVALEAGATLPMDRAFALAHEASRFDFAQPEWRPKGEFLNLVRHERLARLSCRYEDETGRLAILRDGRQIVTGDPTEPTGRDILEQFFRAFLQREATGRVKIARVPGAALSDVPEPVVSLMNLASVQDVERVAHGTLHPHRFRANIYFEGDRPWQEMDWVGKEVALGGAVLRVLEPIQRCGATNVNPDSAERDRNVLLALESGFGHMDLGLYAQVVAGGTVATGDAVIAPAA